MIFVFLTDEAVTEFKNSSGWEVGADSSVAMIDMGKAIAVDSKTITDPIVGFVFGAKGLMVDASLEGTRIDPREWTDK